MPKGISPEKLQKLQQVLKQQPLNKGGFLARLHPEIFGGGQHAFEAETIHHLGGISSLVASPDFSLAERKTMLEQEIAAVKKVSTPASKVSLLAELAQLAAGDLNNHDNIVKIQQIINDLSSVT